jgi:tetratricopeptide (TPR) repeat protein
MTFRYALAAFTIAAVVAPVAQAEPRILVLSEQDEAAYRDAFAAIDSGNWRGVGTALSRANDDVLDGAVRGRMLLSRSYRAGWSDYTSWLNRYGDYGMASAVYDRAMDSRSRRARRNGTHAPEPTAGRGSPPAWHAARDLWRYIASARVAIERVHERIGQGDFEGARELAYAQVGGPRSGQAQWQLGLIAYRMQDYAEAVRQFEASAQWPNHGGWARAGVHYWAARSRLAAGETQRRCATP